MKEIDKIERVLSILFRESNKWNSPVKNFIQNSGENNFQILISTILSSRTKDETTSAVSRRLFSIIKTPEDALLNSDKLEELIYPVGFYRTKARRIVEIAKILKERYNCKVPENINDLLDLPGVGRKTANIVLNRCFGKKVISVDTHVHRISNRLGFVNTKTPYETEIELKKILPEKWWKNYNEIIVAFGQKICTPLSPFCSLCPVEMYCPKINVKRKR